MVTAREIMGEVLGLCRYWRGSGERIRGDELKVGVEESQKSKRPAAFEIRIRNRSEKGKESLHPEEIDAVWDYFLIERRLPRRCPPDVSKERWQTQTALWARECMVWALFMCTGLRRGEAPAIMLEDVRHEAKAGWWVHLIDPRETQTVDARRQKIFDAGAALKTGSRDMIVWFEERFNQVYQRWVQWRPLLVAKTGRPDHGMLLVSGQGRGRSIGDPFTYQGAKSIFASINNRPVPQ